MRITGWVLTGFGVVLGLLFGLRWAAFASACLSIGCPMSALPGAFVVSLAPGVLLGAAGVGLLTARPRWSAAALGVLALVLLLEIPGIVAQAARPASLAGWRPNVLIGGLLVFAACCIAGAVWAVRASAGVAKARQ